MTHPVLQLQQVRRTFSQAENVIEVLRGVNLAIKPGEIVALVGPSGSGKTTLLQIAGLLDNPSSGTVAIMGEDCSVAKDARRTALRRKHIGFVYQFHHLLPEFSALENVVIPQMIQGMPESKAARRALKMLESVGLAERATHRPAKLSGGEQQRVALARALINQPSVLLADEPTGNLDPHTADVVFDMLAQQTRVKGVAALIATHNLELARRMDRIVKMQDGAVSPF